MRSLATRDTGKRDLGIARRSDRRVQGSRASISSSSRRPASGRATPRSSDLVDVSVYVMTPEFGAASQLEKIDMLDFADFVAINKFDRKGAEDALRDVRKQYAAQPRALRHARRGDAGVRHACASRFNDDGVTALYQAVVARAEGARA